MKNTFSNIGHNQRVFPWFIFSKHTVKVWHYLTFPRVFESSKGKLTETFQTKLLLKSVWIQFYFRCWKILKLFMQSLDLSCENMNMRWWEDIDVRASNFSSSSLYENILADPLNLMHRLFSFPRCKPLEVWVLASIPSFSPDPSSSLKCGLI